ncbi:putative rhamnogalacturonan acetylesterase YesY [Botrimarina colliarenosi]|uniref:Putative rhamnogalacturonan acetylesterase YesY n=1 Tax=Botrimarina colliarenosi TaxID=2528001 RepID=A0A5C6ADH5_9BACT|nr:pectinesterase family protein [Botrimarina colliarenosi]TWT97659.1 putative rhamnogalacturonan acetylesterase YesY [Botrimarina colliarenosi]
MSKSLRIALALTLVGIAQGPAAGAPRTLRVEAGSTKPGVFPTIQAAIDTLPADTTERVVIEIADGFYGEKVRIDQDGVTLRGESRQGTRLAYNAPRSEYDRRYDAAGPAVLNVFGKDLVVENLTIENTQTSREHAFAVYGQPDRMILRDCDVLSEGGDTLSLWNTPFGRYYHRSCRFRGGVDFVCPRGWCYARDCYFECPTTSAAIWHDGHMDPDMKFVLRGCRFDGVEQFWLGRNHYPAQFYLLDCEFGENLADKPILTVKDLPPGVDRAPYERKYFDNCHRKGGDYAWHRDNLATAAGAPDAGTIDAAWTFANDWDPESTAAPAVVGVETADDEVHVDFSEPVAGGAESVVQRADATVAAYASGAGSRRLVYRGGSIESPPQTLDPGDPQAIYGLVASLEPRFVRSQELPKSRPRKTVTILLVGDSTVADYPATSPSQGWGRALPRMFDDRVVVANFARGGRSSKSFRAEGHWDAGLQTKPDYVFIQFGHNDNPGKGPERETDPAVGGDYRENLRRYVADARAAGATPILVTPTTRRFYTDQGVVTADGGNRPYAEAALAVAAEVGVPAIDLNRLTRELFDRLGESSSDWMQPVGDRTHFTPAGARRVAAIVAKDLRDVCPELAPMVETDALRERP